jgi:modulator of FtsH protease
MQNYRPYAPAVAQPMASNLAFIRRVYTYLSAGIVFAILGALVALYTGTPVPLDARYGEAIQVPPLVAFEMQHGIVMVIVFFGTFFGAQFARRVPGLNVAALLGYTFITGLFLAPSLFIVMLQAAAGQTADASPVRDAFLLTGASFVGLTSYTFITRKDFSYLGAALSTGLWVVIGAGILAMIFGSSALSLAVASVSVLLFAGYILYDTSRVMQSDERGDAVGAAIQLFLDIVNLFLALLRILARARRD